MFFNNCERNTTYFLKKPTQVKRTDKERDGSDPERPGEWRFTRQMYKYGKPVWYCSPKCISYISQNLLRTESRELPSQIIVSPPPLTMVKYSCYFQQMTNLELTPVFSKFSGGAVASEARSSPERAVRARTLAGDNTAAKRTAHECKFELPVNNAFPVTY